MSNEYHEAFTREAEEQITELNNSLLALESNPADQDAMDAIFRTAHTLKGNAGAMGFERISKLAHAIEDLLDEIRNGRIEVTGEVMDLVFAGVDHVEAMLGEVDESGAASTDPSDVIEEIRTVTEQGANTADAAADAADGDGDGPVTDDLLSDFDADDFSGVDGPVFHVAVAIGDSQMKGVDGMLALEALPEDDLLATHPAREDIEDGDYDDGFELLVTAADAAAVEDAFDGVTSVDEITVTDPETIETTADASTDDQPSSSPRPSQSDDADPTEASNGGRSGAGVDDIKSVRVDVNQLDDLHGLVEQLVTSRIKLRRAVSDDDVTRAEDNLAELDKITSSLQNTVMDVRLIPMKKVVNKFPRLVRDLARQQDKEIDFRLVGEDIELDRTILTQISDPLMHILRNAVDHGIEPPDEREAAGKPRTGSIELRATRERDHVIIEVEDDGRGLDVDALRAKAAEKGVRDPEELEAMDDTDVYDLVFHPGFSTSEQITDVSGRGVGMDVVHSTVKRLDGSVNVDSGQGEGTVVTLRLPVTVAIVTVLFVRVGSERYGIPIKYIDEISQREGVKTINERAVIEHDDEIYPVISLGDALDVADASQDDDGMLLRIRSAERQVALHCDVVEDQEEVVVKPLEGVLSGIPGLSGTAVLGDGNIVPILDVVTL